MARHKSAPAWRGAVAGCVGVFGYRQIGIDGRSYYAHRLAWLYMTGHWPREIDHANGRPGDNSWRNLLASDRSSNMRKAALRRDNSSGVVGVVRTQRGRWQAQLHVGGRCRTFGTFRTFAAAAAARDAAEPHGRPRLRQRTTTGQLRK
jgi:hypothetical protein